MLREYYCRCNLYSTSRRSAPNKKIPQKLLIGTANLPRFAYWRGEGAALHLLAQDAT
jgi:hypothetical protein